MFAVAAGLYDPNCEVLFVLAEAPWGYLQCQYLNPKTYTKELLSDRVYIYIYIYIHTYAYIYIYMHTHTFQNEQGTPDVLVLRAQVVESIRDFRTRYKRTSAATSVARLQAAISRSSERQGIGWWLRA